MIRDHAPEERAVVGVREPEGSPSPSADVELLAMLQEHAPREGQALAAYQRLIDESDDPDVQYLGRLILEDERRHHQVVKEMVAMLESFSSGAPRPTSTPGSGSRSGVELRAATSELLALEREDARELRRLRRAIQGASVPPLLSLLVELMIHDTRKHIGILRAIRGRAARR
jgi:ATP-dependent DNA ligase